MNPSPDFELFARCNHTELFQICRRLGLPVSPQLSKETLIKLLLGEEEPHPEWENVMDGWREALMAFVLDHWEVIRSQLECPAKSGDPRACFNCEDAQVIHCLVDNEHEEPQIRKKLIQLKRKP